MDKANEFIKKSKAFEGKINELKTHQNALETRHASMGGKLNKKKADTPKERADFHKAKEEYEKVGQQVQTNRMELYKTQTEKKAFEQKYHQDNKLGKKATSKDATQTFVKSEQKQGRYSNIYHDANGGKNTPTNATDWTKATKQADKVVGGKGGEKKQDSKAKNRVNSLKTNGDQQRKSQSNGQTKGANQQENRNSATYKLNKCKEGAKNYDKDAHKPKSPEGKNNGHDSPNQ